MINSNSEISVIGAGTMGSGIAQVAAAAGHRVNLIDTNESVLKQSQQNLQKILSRLVEKGKINQSERDSILSNINYSGSIVNTSNSDLVIEAIIEDLKIKKSLFAELEAIVGESTILTTNTSSLSITSIASTCKNSEKVIGTHFFNPAPLMKLVEIIPGIQTSAETTSAVYDLIHSWNKTPVKAKDTPGFIVNKVARPFYGEALRIYEEGIANFATIDHAMKMYGGFKMGPFELMDLIGNDVNYKVTETVFKEFYFDQRYKPSITQKRLVEANMFGRKTGKGFYNYNVTETVNISADLKLLEYIFDRIIVMLINEAADTVLMNIASEHDVDLAMKHGVNYPKGLFEWLHEISPQQVINVIEELYSEYKEDRYRTSPYLNRML